MTSTDKAKECAMAAGELLWTPPKDVAQTSRMGHFMAYVQARHGLSLEGDYARLWDWSVNDVASFWTAIWDYFGVIAHTAPEQTLASARMPGAHWFPGGRTRAAALMTAGLVTVAVVSGASALENDPATGVAYGPTALMSDDARQRAAERADRFGRGFSSAPAEANANAAAEAKPGAAAAAAKAEAAKKAAAAKKAPAWVTPMNARLSSCFGPRWGVQHQGIDFAGRAGTKIASVGAGTVVATGWLYSGYGISVMVDHGNGYLSHYAHASKVLVKKGQKVKAGTALALEGSTGDSTGPHLHFEVHKGLWNQINPATWLRARGIKVGC